MNYIGQSYTKYELSCPNVFFEDSFPYPCTWLFTVTITLLFSIVLVITKIIQFCVSCLLLYGTIEVCLLSKVSLFPELSLNKSFCNSIQKDYGKCQIWFIYGFVLIGLAVLVIIFESSIRDSLVQDATPMWMRLIIPVSEILVNWYVSLHLMIITFHQPCTEYKMKIAMTALLNCVFAGISCGLFMHSCGNSNEKDQ